jgi:hypothetical protein
MSEIGREGKYVVGDLVVRAGFQGPNGGRVAQVMEAGARLPLFPA